MEKVGYGQRLCNSAYSLFFGGAATHRQGEVEKGDVKLLWETFTMPICCGKYELWPSMSWKKLARVKDCIMQIVNLGGTHRQGEVWKRDVIFM